MISNKNDNLINNIKTIADELDSRKQVGVAYLDF